MGLLDFFKQTDINQGVEEFCATTGAALVAAIITGSITYQLGYMLGQAL